MTIGRRKFFGLAAGAAVGGKKIASDVLADMGQGMAAGGGLNFPPAVPFGGGDAPIDHLTHLQAQVAKMAALRAVGVPPLVRDFIRNWSGAPEPNLDDINSLVSVSDTAKKRMIRERLEEQRFDDWLNGPSRSLKREMLRRELGQNFGADL